MSFILSGNEFRLVNNENLLKEDHMNGQSALTLDKPCTEVRPGSSPSPNQKVTQWNEYEPEF